jgi:hypothetical protein
MEYQAASHMIRAGMYGEALELVQAVRDRYDGERRNPWNEIECGSNYARAMSSYALLLAVSGFRYDMGRGILGFLPQDPAAKREYFWSVDSAWGVYAQSARTRTLRVLAGEIRLTRLETDQPVAGAALNGQPVRVRGEGNTAVFEPPLALKSGDALILS